MGFSTRTSKIKLPRKRKKAAIKAQGRQWYYATIKFYKAAQKGGIFKERRCKFWVNESVIQTPVLTWDGVPMMIPTPTKYW